MKEIKLKHKKQKVKIHFMIGIMKLKNKKDQQ